MYVWGRQTGSSSISWLTPQMPHQPGWARPDAIQVSLTGVLLPSQAQSRELSWKQSSRDLNGCSGTECSITRGGLLLAAQCRALGILSASSSSSGTPMTWMVVGFTSHVLLRLHCSLFLQPTFSVQIGLFLLSLSSPILACVVSILLSLQQVLMLLLEEGLAGTLTGSG